MKETPAGRKTKEKGKRSPDQKVKDDVFRDVVEEYRKSPEDMWSCYPHIAAKLDRYFVAKRPAPGTQASHYSYLTERDKAYRLQTLKKAIEELLAGGTSAEVAIPALEDGAALGEAADVYRDTLLEILNKVLQFPANLEKEEVIYFQKGKPEHHTYNLARGITLYLTWDRKLIKIAFDPAKFAYGQKLMSFVGIVSDTQADVARRHDEYLEDAFAD